MPQYRPEVILLARPPISEEKREKVIRMLDETIDVVLAQLDKEREEAATCPETHLR